MTLSGRSTFAKLGAVIGIAALAAACLALTPDPPADPILGTALEQARGALGAPLQSAFLLGLLGGLLLLGGLATAAVRQYVKGARLDVWSYLQRRLVNTLLAYGLLTLVALALHSRKPRIQPPPAPQPPPIAQPEAAPGTPLPQTPPTIPAPAPASPWPWLTAAAALLAGAGLLAVGLRRGRGQEAPPAVADGSARLATARRRLELGDQVRDAIIGCYAEMCDVFGPRAASGARSLTAREFAALLRSHGIGQPEITALTSVFEKARYSPEPCDEADRARAVEALRLIEERYGSPEPAEGLRA